MRSALVACAAGALSLTLPLPANADDLTCMEKSYTSQELDVIADAARAADFGDGASMNEDAELIFQMAALKSVECANTHAWTEDAVEGAVLYEIGRAGEAAIRAGRYLAAEDLRILDDALSSGDRSALWRAIEITVADETGTADWLGAHEAAAEIDRFVIELGIDPDSDRAERLGVLFGLMGLQRYGAAMYARIAGGK